LLALDTATPAVTVALHDGRDVIASSSQVDARRHGELLLPAIDRVLTGAGLKLDAVTGVVAGIGPGPYTGLRVGLMTVPVHGVCTLDGLAYATDLAGPFVVATDARRKEVYWARYADSRTRVTDPAVDRPADIAEQVAGLPAVGAGALLYPDTFPQAHEPEHVSAAALARLAAEKLAAGEELPAPRPLYLRRPDAQVPKNYKVVTPK
jgi:tRNA threonylcarbamoyl adenosine modification protein YeaZ